MAKLFEMLQKQDGRLSLARLAAVVTIILWWGTWIYTLLLKQTYAHFDTITLAMLSELFVILMGKAIDGKLIKVGDNNERAKTF